MHESLKEQRKQDARETRITFLLGATCGFLSTVIPLVFHLAMHSLL